MPWIPLNVHSQFSILDSTLSVKALAKQAKAFNIPAIALTDQGNLYGAIEFYKACMEVGIKPILGLKIWMAPVSRLEKKRVYGQPNGLPIILLAKDNQGYHNLCKLSSIGFTEGFYYQPRIDKETLEQHREGLICLNGASNSPIGYQILHETGESLLQEIAWYQTLFGKDLYLTLQRYPITDPNSIQEGWLHQKMESFVSSQDKINEQLLSLSKTKGIQLVATNEIRYLKQEDWKAHEVLLNVQSGESIEIWERDSMGNAKNKILNPKRDIAISHEFYFKSPDAIAKLFEDLPEAIHQTSHIADQCNVKIDFTKKHYPVFTPPTFSIESTETRQKQAETYLLQICSEAIPKRYGEKECVYVRQKYPHQDPLDVVKHRLNHEFTILSSKGMCDYLLIVFDFIHWAKSQKIPVGPGRGSAAGSIISYLIGITDIEPLRFNLFFERFINPERISYPDIDVDICMNRRQDVIEYVINKYGKDKVAQIITFGTMKAKMAIRDVGRVLGVPLSKVNQIANLVPEDPNMTLEKAFELDPELKSLMDTDEESARVLKMAQTAEGSIRNTSTHAAGLIISEDAITEHIPICTAKDSDMLVTQFAMKPVESVGMLKIDFLGLKTLTSLQICVTEIERTTGRQIDWNTLPLEDQHTFDLMNQGKTLGIFQLESGGMADLIKQLRIDVFEEIIAVVALYRPGPMDMIPSFINRKHGKETIEIDHPLMKDILSETYGVMVYQEQVMQIASTLAGYSLGEGDVLRRAMGKKDKKEMGNQRVKFIAGCVKNEISETLAATIFDKIEKFASYGFNKSHAAAYGYLSYATCYFKAHYPKHWMAALMTSDKDDTTKVAKFIMEAKSLGIDVLPPDINEASDSFASAEKGIRFAISAIKGVGSHIVEEILRERNQNGPFVSLYEFIQRTLPSKIGKKQIELLIEAGCFDFTKWSRDQLRSSVEPMIDHASQIQREASLGVMDLFAPDTKMDVPFSTPPSVLEPSSRTHLLQREKDLLGFYLTGHPMDAFQNVLQQLSCVPFKDFDKLPARTVIRAAFVIDSAQIKISSKSQKKFAILTISDGMEKFELPIWPELFAQKLDLIQENQLVYALMQVEKKDQKTHLSCKFIEDLSTLNEAQIKTCDELFDKLKTQVQRPEAKWKKEKQKVVMKEEKKHLTISLNADQVKLSDILTLKDLLRTHPGSATLDIHFLSGKRTMGTLSIDEKWGVSADPVFESKLENFKSLFTSTS